MKKEYMKPEAEKLSFQPEEEMMTNMGPDIDTGVGKWPSAGMPTAL